MARFEYEAKSTHGARTANVVYAESAEAAVDVLHRDGYVVLSIREAKEGIKERLSGSRVLFGMPVSTGVVALFTKQLAAMFNAGLPVIRALYGLAREERNRAFSDALVRVATDIESGETLSNAMAKHGSVFSKVYVSMVRSGERSGTLGVILGHLVKYMNRTEAIKRKVKAAMTYPMFVVGFAVLATIVLMLRIVPLMANIYDSLGANLPGPTKMVIAVSHALGRHFWLLPVLLLALLIAHRALRRTPAGRLSLDSFKLRMPIFGAIIQKVVIAKYLRTLGVLVESGLPIIDALELAGETAGNEVVERASQDIARHVSRGAGLSLGFRAAGIFPEIVVQMITTGEETGRLGEMLTTVSDHYDDQVEASVEGLASLIEPLLIVMVGGLIALMLVAMFLPVFHLGGAIRQSM
ncbi:MAG: type II secretion system F family protein [Candidatus Eisenbacteria bacterium]|nr:type II secretion system F family protein [Candidatus Eisenbacteria bacterium]